MAARILTSRPAVLNFEWLRQVSQMNKIEFGFSEVADFLEIDYALFVPD